MYAELKKATNNLQHKEYSRSLLETIYKGWVHENTYAPEESGDGLEIYVKMAWTREWEVDFKVEEFINQNLVNLLGYHQSVGNRIYLVYELNPDAGLDKLLFREIRTSPLSWVARLKIAIGAAHLSFLHRRKRLSYKQFKTAVILVDKWGTSVHLKIQTSLIDVTLRQSGSVQRMWQCGATEVISSGPGMKAFDEYISNLIEWATPLLTHI
uniref:serine/threonine-protein kinase PBL36-like n=1 Tax=Erigeron canadensis TaxID=72917 RepID=UPI001CB8A55F|nr:serine/threonine-protein kinase PBL36-like [Erigeron canadensis]